MDQIDGREFQDKPSKIRLNTAWGVDFSFHARVKSVWHEICLLCSQLFRSGGVRMRPCDKSIRNTISLAEMMVKIADEGDMVREDNGCGVLYGVLRDSAFKIRKLAEAEKNAHIRKGWWESDSEKR